MHFFKFNKTFLLIPPPHTHTTTFNNHTNHQDFNVSVSYSTICCLCSFHKDIFLVFFYSYYMLMIHRRRFQIYVILNDTSLLFKDDRRNTNYDEGNSTLSLLLH